MTKLIHVPAADFHRAPIVAIGDLAHSSDGAFKIGPFGSSLKKGELVSDGIPVVGIENVLPNNFVKGFHRFITAKKFRDLADYKIVPGDILITTMGTIGRAAIAPSELGPAIIDSHLFRMRIDVSRVLPEYLCYAINSSVVTRQLERKARGAIMDGLNTSILKECEIPLPSLDEQAQAVSVLKKADRLRYSWHFALRLSDEFLPATFIQMFGDPSSNPMGWDQLTIDDVLDWSQYGTSKKSNSSKVGYPVLGMTNLTYDGQIRLTPLSYVDLSEHEFQELRLQPGDIVFNRTNSTELVGKTACWRSSLEAVVASYLVRLRLKPKVDPEFFAALLNTRYFKTLFQERCKKAVGQSNISPTLLREFRIYVPPIERQRTYARFVEMQLGHRASLVESARQADHLFEAVLRQAF